jgi:hypothetical protein
MRLSRVLQLAALLLTAACGGGDSAGAGTARMADTLTKLNAALRSDPLAVPFLNKARATMFEASSGGDGQQAMQNRYLAAQERLLAGDTRAAIAALERLVTDAKITLDARAPQNKAFYDLLGMSYLRLGEQENCALNPAANMCILPLDGAARHERDEGARKAVNVYERMLKAFPDDAGTRYLLNIAYLALGEYPYKVPKQWLIPNLARKTANFPLFHNVAGDVGVAIEGLSGGLSVEDFNGDGLLDMFMSAFGPNDPVHLFIADGKGGYSDATANAGLKGIVGGLNNTHADFDNDGDEDILIFRGAWLGDAGFFPMSLLRNRGDATFEDVTFAAGLGSLHTRHSGAWVDVNLDGNLDLFVGSESQAAMNGKAQRSELFINKGDGTFVERSHDMGIDLEAFVKGVTVIDANNDGWPDLFAAVHFGAKRLWLNRGGKRFEEISASSGLAGPMVSFPTWSFDYDNDGLEDLLVLSYDIRKSGSLHDAVAMEYLGKPPADVEASRLYKNNGNGTFTDVTRASGLEDKVIFAMGSNYGDLDNDGFLDFYLGTGNPDLRSIIPNRMFRGVDGKRFEEVTLEGGFAHIQKGHATAFVDLDRDGDEDVYMIMGGAYEGDRFTSVLFENPGWPDRNWITLELKGKAANRSAIGARVALTVADAAGSTRVIHRTIGTGGSFGAGSLQLHVGLGKATQVRDVTINWPDAARSKASFANLEPKKTYRIVQGESPVALDRPPIPFRKGSGMAHDSTQHTKR